MNDLIDRLQNYKTTFLGLVTALFTILGLTGVLNPDNQGGAVENVNVVYTSVIGILGALSSLIMLFSKDGVEAQTRGLSDFVDRIKNWKTTFVGLIFSIVSVLVLFKVINPENQQGVLDNLTIIYDSIVAVLSGLSGLFLLLSKDS